MICLSSAGMSARRSAGKPGCTQSLINTDHSCRDSDSFHRDVMQSISHFENPSKHCSTRYAPSVKLRLAACSISFTFGRLLTSVHVYRKPATGEWNSLDSTNKTAVSRSPNARIPPPPHCSQYSAGKLAFLGDGIWTVRATSHGCFDHEPQPSCFEQCSTGNEQTREAGKHQRFEPSSS